MNDLADDTRNTDVNNDDFQKDIPLVEAVLTEDSSVDNVSVLDGSPPRTISSIIDVSPMKPNMMMSPLKLINCFRPSMSTFFEEAETSPIAYAQQHNVEHMMIVSTPTKLTIGVRQQGVGLVNTPSTSMEEEKTSEDTAERNQADGSKMASIAFVEEDHALKDERTTPEKVNANQTSSVEKIQNECEQRFTNVECAFVEGEETSRPEMKEEEEKQEEDQSLKTVSFTERSIVVEENGDIAVVPINQGNTNDKLRGQRRQLVLCAGVTFSILLALVAALLSSSNEHMIQVLATIEFWIAEGFVSVQNTLPGVDESLSSVQEKVCDVIGGCFV